MNRKHLITLLLAGIIALADDKARLTELQHLYFNVTSEYLRETGHLWDCYSVPEAAGTAYAWKEA